MKHVNIFKIYLILSILLTLSMQLVNINVYITDYHGFRQTQTAITVFYFLEDGIKMPYLTPVFGWPWSVPFEFPIYQILVTLFIKLFNISNIDLAGRIVSLIFYYLSLYVVYMILKNLNVNTNSIAIILIFIILSPVYIFWSRTFMIESTALFFSLLTIYLIIFISENKTGEKYFYLLILLFGILATLTKITTFIVSLVFILFYFLFIKPNNILTKKTIFIFITILISIIIGFAWTKYTDSIKSLNPIASYVTSKNLTSWNFGTFQQRVNFNSYIEIYRHIIENNGYAIIILIFFPVIFIGNIKEKRLILVCLGVFITSIMVLFNLYRVHNYYYYANNLYLSIAIALFISSFVINIKKGYLLHFGFLFILLISVYSYKLTYYTQHTSDQNYNRVVNIAKLIKENTDKNDIIYIKGLDWSSELPYYSKRKAIMIPGWGQIDIGNSQFKNILENSLNDNNKIGALVLCGLKSEEIVQRLKYFNFKNMNNYGDEHCLLFLNKNPKKIIY